MLLEKESHVLEKLKLLSVALDYAEKKGANPGQQPVSRPYAQLSAR